MKLLKKLRLYLYAVRMHLDFLYELQADKYVMDLLALAKYQDSKRLNKYEFAMFSQCGEDGIIAEIFMRIGMSDKIFVEFGAADGLENNTHYLLLQGWKGFWFESDKENVKKIQKEFAAEIKSGRLLVFQETLTRENINIVFAASGVPKEFDLLSIDIDRNDYWVWKAIEGYAPRLVVVEYNSSFPPSLEWIIEYNPTATWDGSRVFGASLASLQILGAEKGFSLVGCNLAGTNAFFVQSALVGDKFCVPASALNHYEPPRYYLALRKRGHPIRPR
jgi:hypothetical protein